MIEQMSYEAVSERMTEYRRQGEEARRVKEAMSQRQNVGAMRFRNAADAIVKIVGRWGWQAAQPATRL